MDSDAGPSSVFVTLIVIGSAILATPLALLSWWSIRNLLQSKTLLEWSLASPDQPRPGDRVTLRGIPRIIQPLKDEDQEILWMRRRIRKWSQDPRESRRIVESNECRCAGFSIDLEGRSVRVEPGSHQVEVHATSRKSTYSEDTSRFRFLIRGPGTQTTRWWLPVGVRMTIVGRLQARGEEWILAPDSKAGMLLSPRDPRHQARRELAKGLAGIVMVTLLVTLGLLVYLEKGRPYLPMIERALRD